MTIENLQQNLIEDFSFFEDWTQRYEYMIELSKGLEKMDEKMKNHKNISYNSVLKNVTNRDKKDTNRLIAPLKKVSDSIIIDTTDMSIDQAFHLMLNHLKNI